MAAAIKWTADRGYDLANLSLGKTGSTEVIGDAVRYASRRDVLLVGAAGNSEPCSDCVIYPAAHEVGIAISAVDCGGEWERYSSQGNAVELAGVAGRRQPPSAVDIAPSPARPLLPPPPPKRLRGVGALLMATEVGRSTTTGTMAEAVAMAVGEMVVPATMMRATTIATTRYVTT